MLHLIVVKGFARKLGADILEHCTADKLKETVCKAYENIGITTSLVMTTVVGLLIEGHEISPAYHCADPRFIMHLRLTFVTVNLLCIRASVVCVLYAVVSHFYLNALTEVDVMHYMTTGNGCYYVGKTAIYLVEAYVLFALAITLWMGSTYGIAVFIITSVGLLQNSWKVIELWWSLGKYAPPGAEDKQRLKDQIDLSASRKSYAVDDGTLRVRLGLASSSISPKPLRMPRSEAPCSGKAGDIDCKFIRPALWMTPGEGSDIAKCRQDFLF